MTATADIVTAYLQAIAPGRPRTLQVAEAAALLGVAYGTVERWLAGRQVPSDAALTEISRRLGAPERLQAVLEERARKEREA